MEVLAYVRNLMLRKVIWLLFIVFSLSVYAQTVKPLFNNELAERVLKQSEKMLKQKNINITNLTGIREKLAEAIEGSQGCIKRQKSNYKKLESTLQIVTIPSLDVEGATDTADLSYLKNKQQVVRKRLGTCSLYQLKSKDVLDQLDKAIITQTKHQTWKKSDNLLFAVMSPLKAFNNLSLSLQSESLFLTSLAKYIGCFVTGIVLLIFFFKNRPVRLFIKQLQLKSMFLLGASISIFALAIMDCFLTYQVGVYFETSSSQIFFKWLYLGFLYLLTLIYGAWFLQAHPDLRLSKIRLPLLILLIISFSATFSLALYGYPYLAYYISMGILQTLEGTMIALIFMILSSKLSKNLNHLLAQSSAANTYNNDEAASTPPKMEIEFKVLALSLKASIILYWLTVCIHIWKLSLSADRVLLKWVHDGFSFLNIHVVPVDFVKAGLIFSIITILLRIIAKTMFKGINPILLNFSYLIAGLSALYVAGVNLTGIAVVAGALSVGIGMGLRGIVNNFISGLILLIEKPIKRGDRIIVNEVEGYVKNIGLRSTEIQTPTNTDVIVPNEQLITSMVTNYMLTEASSISSIEVGIAYGANVELAQEILLRIAKAHPHIISNKKTAPWVCLKSFADSAIVLQLIYTIKHATFLFRTKSDLNNSIYQAFKKEGIEFPFPQSDVYIKEFPSLKNDTPKPEKD